MKDERMLEIKQWKGKEETEEGEERWQEKSKMEENNIRKGK